MNAAPGSVEYWAREKPNAIAIIDGNKSLTYAAWNDRADRLAHSLTRLGVEAGDIVVARLQIRSEWAVISAALGKLGCKLLGLNWRLTPTETKYVLANSGARVVICDDPDPAALLPALDGLNIKLAISIDAEASGFESYKSLLSEAAPRPLLSKANPPLIIYTSGTTGLPKGVVMGQPTRGTADGAIKEMLEYFQSVADSRPSVPEDVVLCTMPMHHGAGPAVAWGALRLGNLLILQRRFDPEETLKLIEKHRVTVWTGVPTMYKRLAGLAKDVLAKYDVSSIRSLGVGAAPVPHSLKQWIIAYFGNCLGEGYGTTETGMITELPAAMQTMKPGSSGLPFKNVYLRIRDEDCKDLPPGSIGEIWAKTPVVIRQYLNGKPLEGDTLDREGFYRTGDVGRIDDEGYLFITDRVKDMIVSGGVNIYPAEIEAAILSHSAVQDVAVIGIPDDEFGEQVKAFCELKPGQTVDVAAILAHCTQTLASYKRPRSIDIVKELPRNTMGKLLKRELREPYWTGRDRKV